MDRNKDYYCPGMKLGKRNDDQLVLHSSSLLLIRVGLLCEYGVKIFAGNGSMIVNLEITNLNKF